MLLAIKKPKLDIKFGPPYAVFNLSKLGLRYFRIGLNVSPSSRERLVKNLKEHPNVGWIFSAEGWFNLAVGIWARDNAEINDVAVAIRNTLAQGDKVVFQSELTSLYSFGNRAVGKPSSAMPIIDPVYENIEFSPIELDYIKLVAMDSATPKVELATILNITEKEVNKVEKKLMEAGVIVGYQERIDYGGFYFKVFVDTASKKTPDAVERITERLWNDEQCIYFERANATYDLEFELILEKKSDIKKYAADFSEYQTAILTKNLYTNLYPLSKIANLNQIREVLSHQDGSVIDFGNSKLWYLNYEGTKGYLSIYENPKYFEAMEKSELDLFDDVVAFVREHNPNALFNIFDLGSGDGMKSRRFIQKLGENRVKAYYPIDVQPMELAVALKEHSQGPYAKHPTLIDFENLSARFPLKLGPGEKQIYLFLGGTYGNYPSATINRYIKELAGPSSMLFVSMPVRTGKSDREIINQYTGLPMEAIGFGPLAQIGFEKQDFERNPHDPSLYVQVMIEHDRLRTAFQLKNDVIVGGRKFNRGTIFKMTTSWKPTLQQIRSAFEADFVVEKMFLNDAMSISLLGKKD